MIGGRKRGIQESAGRVFSRWTDRIVRWGLALVFLYAGTVKLMDPKAFARSISQYDLAPDFLLPVPAIGLPLVEILGAVGPDLRHSREPEPDYGSAPLFCSGHLVRHFE